ncbi:hypothetical protein OHC33_003922 [Knufia fluminis]|uniref:Uncharacterized protein n=1 Tax=Knufia fluminis TaxID=191047 RepID=A0AAN8FBL3_9EURO|nr:hypothetical protein OHC33_003922 [Knufia fluminis]
MSGVAPPQGVTNYFIYNPVHGASIAFAVLFTFSGFGHIWQNNLKYKSYRIGFLLPWASLIFTAGFILREYGSYHTDKLDIFIASQVLLFVAPPVYNGANYFIFGRALYYLPYLSPIHPGRVWSTFIALDGIADAIAANGAVRAANADATEAARKAGLDLVKVSLFLLLGMFLAFMSLNVQFHYRARKMGVFNYKMKVIMYELYASNILILLRNCFRTAAFFYPWNSVANSREWPVWVFEFVPMLINTYIMNIWPPARYLAADHKVYLAMDGKTEIQGPGMIDKRPFLVTLVDPFDIWGLIKKKDQKNRYWLKDGIGGPLPEVQSSAGEASEAGHQVVAPKTVA